MSALHAETIVVTGSREPLALERLAADVVVIDAATIRASSADSVADLLRREAGLQMSRNGGSGHSTSLFLRGASTGQTVVLIDGVRVGSATLGQPSFEGLALAQIERIEVLRGPGSSLYGADAIGGVIQIFTRRGDGKPRFTAELSVGSYGSVNGAASASANLGDWDLAASLSHDKSDGVSALRAGDQFGNYNADDDGFRRSGLQAQIGFRPAAGQRIGLSLLRTRLNAQYDASEYLPPSYAQDNTADFRSRLNTEASTLDWRGDLGAGLVGSARAALSEDDLRSGGNEIGLYRTQRQLYTGQLAWQTGVLGQLTGALEQLEEKASSSAFLVDVKRRNTAAVLVLTGDAGPWSWQADLRRDDSSDYGAVTTGRLGGAFRLTPTLRLRALAGTAFRAPSFNDLYYPDYGVGPEYGAAAVKPEHGRSVELGLNWRAGDSEAAATVYRNRVRDLIAYEGDRTFCPADPGYDFGCARNINRARLDGATLSGQQRSGALLLKAQLDFLNARDEITDQRLTRRAAHQESLSLVWNPGSWDAGATLLRVGARPDGSATLPAETTLDLQAGWRFASGWSLLGKLLNATDRDLHPARDYQSLGRQAWLGLRYEGGL